MTRADLIESKRVHNQRLQELFAKLKELHKKYRITDDDDRYGTPIQETKDEIKDVQAELNFIREELEADRILKEKGLF